MTWFGWVKVNVDVGNDATQTPEALADILREAARVLESPDTAGWTGEHYSTGSRLLDANGNDVGRVRLVIRQV